MSHFRTVFNAKTSKWNLQFLHEVTLLGVPVWHKWVTATRLNDSQKTEVVEFETFGQLHAYVVERGVAQVYAHVDQACGVDFTKPAAQQAAEAARQADLLHKAIDALAATRQQSAVLSDEAPTLQSAAVTPATIRRLRQAPITA